MIGRESSGRIWNIAVILVDDEFRHLAPDHWVAKYAKGGENVARRKLTRDEGEALAAEAEQLRDDEAAWDYDNARAVRRGRSPSAVLSVRVPLMQLATLRELAATERVSLSELLKDAVASYVASTGPQVLSSGPRVLRLNLPPSKSESMQQGARQPRETVVGFPRSDTETTIAG